MKTLYQINTPYNRGDVFFWANNSEEALEMAHQQGLARDASATADRVWANNDDPKYKGYVAEEKL